MQETIERYVKDIADCPVCGHTGRHVKGAATLTIYCLVCGGPCRDAKNPRQSKARSQRLTGTEVFS